MIHTKKGKVIQPINKDMESCPVCNNRMGFAFGTCSECGFNYIEGEFRYIKVDTDYLPKELKEFLIKKHATRFNVKTYSYIDRCYDYEYD